MTGRIAFLFLLFACLHCGLGFVSFPPNTLPFVYTRDPGLPPTVQIKINSSEDQRSAGPISYGSIHTHLPSGSSLKSPGVSLSVASPLHPHDMVNGMIPSVADQSKPIIPQASIRNKTPLSKIPMEGSTVPSAIMAPLGSTRMPVMSPLVSPTTQSRKDTPSAGIFPSTPNIRTVLPPLLSPQQTSWKHARIGTIPSSPDTSEPIMPPVSNSQRGLGKYTPTGTIPSTPHPSETVMSPISNPQQGSRKNMPTGTIPSTPNMSEKVLPPALSPQKSSWKHAPIGTLPSTPDAGEPVTAPVSNAQKGSWKHTSTGMIPSSPNTSKTVFPPVLSPSESSWKHTTIGTISSTPDTSEPVMPPVTSPQKSSWKNIPKGTIASTPDISEPVMPPVSSYPKGSSKHTPTAGSIIPSPRMSPLVSARMPAMPPLIHPISRNLTPPPMSQPIAKSPEQLPYSGPVYSGSVQSPMSHGLDLKRPPISPTITSFPPQHSPLTGKYQPVLSPASVPRNGPQTKTPLTGSVVPSPSLIPTHPSRGMIIPHVQQPRKRSSLKAPDAPAVSPPPLHSHGEVVAAPTPTRKGPFSPPPVKGFTAPSPNLIPPNGKPAPAPLVSPNTGAGKEKPRSGGALSSHQPHSPIPFTHDSEAPHIPPASGPALVSANHKKGNSSPVPSIPAQKNPSISPSQAPSNRSREARPAVPIAASPDVSPPVPPREFVSPVASPSAKRSPNQTPSEGPISSRRSNSHLRRHSFSAKAPTVEHPAVSPSPSHNDVLVPAAEASNPSPGISLAPHISPAISVAPHLSPGISPRKGSKTNDTRPASISPSPVPNREAVSPVASRRKGSWRQKPLLGPIHSPSSYSPLPVAVEPPRASPPVSLSPQGSVPASPMRHPFNGAPPPSARSPGNGSRRHVPDIVLSPAPPPILSVLSPSALPDRSSRHISHAAPLPSENAPATSPSGVLGRKHPQRTDTASAPLANAPAISPSVIPGKRHRHVTHTAFAPVANAPAMSPSIVTGKRHRHITHAAFAPLATSPAMSPSIVPGKRHRHITHTAFAPLTKAPVMPPSRVAGKKHHHIAHAGLAPLANTPASPPSTFSGPAPSSAPFLANSPFTMSPPRKPHVQGISPNIAPSKAPPPVEQRTPAPSLIFPPPPPSKECSTLSCTPPMTSAPPDAPCGCVYPMQVQLQLGVALYAFFPLVSELASEIASGTYLKLSQVRIMGANADSESQDKTLVLVHLVPLGEKFDNTTAFLIFERFWGKKVYINQTLFGDYQVIYVIYPGLPPSPPSALTNPADGGQDASKVGPRRVQPFGVYINKHGEKLGTGIIAILALVSSIALLICFGAIWLVFVKFKNRCRANSVALEPPHLSSLTKRSGYGGSVLSGSMVSSTSMSFASSMVTYTGSAKTFALSELEKATDKFNPRNVLGEGGFGRVYRGILEDGTNVAVKVLTRDDQQGGREFIAEVEMLSRLHHRNLVKLIGICTEEQKRCLVYELIPNGSVESHLHGPDKETAPLDWDARIKIALGAARGLAYLHEDSSPRVIHRDFKASNILLENDFTPKVSDFGLAKSASEEVSGHISTKVMGTFGYVAPEYAMTGHLLVKSDVYSYGVVLLELLTGRKPVDMSQPQGQENLVTWARPLLTSREGLETLIDPALGSNLPFDNIARVAAIASMCVQPEVSHRPFMGEVVQALKLVYNDSDASNGVGSGSVSRGESYDAGAKESSTNQWPSKNQYLPDSGSFVTIDYDSGPLRDQGCDIERPLSASALMSNSGNLPRELSRSFRRHSTSGPIRSTKNRRNWYGLKGLMRGSISEHGFMRKFGIGSD